MSTASTTLDVLRSRISHLQTGATVEAPSQRWIPTPYKALNDCLPGGGLPSGSLVELLADGPGGGALELALRLGAALMLTRPAWVLLDSDGHFYPPSVSRMGLDIERMVVVRAPARQAAWAFTHVLRCQEVGVAILSTESMDNMQQRRFQLAVQRGGGIGLVLRPLQAQRRACWAQVRLKVQPLASAQDEPLRPHRRWKIEVLHARGASAVAACEVEAM